MHHNNEVEAYYMTQIFADQFESGTFIPPDPWTGTIEIGATIVVSSDFAHHGSKSALISGMGVAGDQASDTYTYTSEKLDSSQLFFIMSMSCSTSNFERHL